MKFQDRFEMQQEKKQQQKRLQPPAPTKKSTGLPARFPFKVSNLKMRSWHDHLNFQVVCMVFLQTP